MIYFYLGLGLLNIFVIYLSLILSKKIVRCSSGSSFDDGIYFEFDPTISLEYSEYSNGDIIYPNLNKKQKTLHWIIMIIVSFFPFINGIPIIFFVMCRLFPMFCYWINK